MSGRSGEEIFTEKAEKGPNFETALMPWLFPFE
jgi:hypothetical protein